MQLASRARLHRHHHHRLRRLRHLHRNRPEATGILSVNFNIKQAFESLFCASRARQTRRTVRDIKRLVASR